VSSEKILDQAEIDALIHGVDSGAVSTEATPGPDEVRNYDFNNQMRIVRGRMPTLEMINERFARLFRVSLYNLLRRSPEISVAPVAIKKFSEYVHTLHVPTNLNLVKINPFRGTALIMLDPKFVFAVVDSFFGGSGRHAKIEGRDFTATEQRIIHMLLRNVFADLHEEWAHVANIDV
jgi:flagellar motor switch protein FliM